MHQWQSSSTPHPPLIGGDHRTLSFPNMFQFSTIKQSSSKAKHQIWNDLHLTKVITSLVLWKNTSILMEWATETILPLSVLTSTFVKLTHLSVQKEKSMVIGGHVQKSLSKMEKKKKRPWNYNSWIKGAKLNGKKYPFDWEVIRWAIDVMVNPFEFAMSFNCMNIWCYFIFRRTLTVKSTLS